MRERHQALRDRYLPFNAEDAFFAGAMDVEGLGRLLTWRFTPQPMPGHPLAYARIDVGGIRVEFWTANPMSLLDLASSAGIEEGMVVTFQGRVRDLQLEQRRMTLGRFRAAPAQPWEEPSLLHVTGRMRGTTMQIGNHAFAVPPAESQTFRLVPLLDGLALEPVR